MPGQRQDDAIRSLIRRGVLPVPTDRFRPAPSGARIECAICGALGYGPLDPSAPGFDGKLPIPGRWQLVHLLPHTYGCSCGLAFVSAAAWAMHLYSDRHDPKRHSLRHDTHPDTEEVIP